MTTRREFLKKLGLAGFSTLALSSGFPSCLMDRRKRPNVVLIICDDLNDYVSGMGGHPQARTPHIERFASSAVSFNHAYSNNPVCAPSRASFLTGIYPHTSRNLFWDKWYENPVLKNSKTMMEYFKENGYLVVGSGKIMHHHRGEDWDHFGHKADYGPFVFDGENRVAHPSVPEPFNSIGVVDGSFAPLSDVPFAADDDESSGWITGRWNKVEKYRYVNAENRDPTPDERNADWATEKIKVLGSSDSEQPFFLGVGFIRPHTPLHVPQRYFDMYPEESVEVPVIKTGDAEDTHFADLFTENQKGLRYYRLLKKSFQDDEAGLRAFTQAYLASVAAVDDCVGQVIEAVNNSPASDNTIVIVTSDHGWNMGEKDYLFKNSLWEESCRIPFIVRAPGVSTPGKIADRPISLIDLYPSLVYLCGLEGDTRKNQQGAPLDGHSVRSLLEAPAAGRWEGPEAALTMVHADEDAVVELTPEQYVDPACQHWSVRTRKYRYIIYNNGLEEFYDHDNDPFEWYNLAGDDRYTEVKTRHRDILTEMTGLSKIGSKMGSPVE